MFMSLVLFSMFSAQAFENPCLNDMANGVGYARCIRFNVMKQFKDLEDGPEKAEVFTRLFSELTRAQRMVVEEFEDGRIKAWQAANATTYIYEYMADLVMMTDDRQTAQMIMEYGLILQMGVREELIIRRKIAELYPVSEQIEMLEKIAFRPGFLAESLARGRADCAVALSLSRLYVAEGRNDEALAMLEQYLVWVSDNGDRTSPHILNKYLKLRKNHRAEISAAKLKKIRKKLERLYDKKLLSAEYLASKDAENQILAENWRDYLAMNDQERRLAVRAMDF